MHSAACITAVSRALLRGLGRRKYIRIVNRLKRAVVMRHKADVTSRRRRYSEVSYRENTSWMTTTARRATSLCRRRGRQTEVPDRLSLDRRPTLTPRAPNDQPAAPNVVFVRQRDDRRCFRRDRPRTDGDRCRINHRPQRPLSD